MSKIGFVFPGQGSQHVGMLEELASRYALITEHFTEVSNTLGYDLWQLIQQGPEEQLNQTEYTQVAMLTADVAVYHLMQQLKPCQVKSLAGHSLGEYAALVAANALSLTEAAKLVAKRGQLMQSKLPLGLGAMAAIVGLTNEEVESLCIKASNTNYQVTPANYNAIGQVVIAGHFSAVEKALELANQLGAKLAKLIPVSVPCHCPLLKDAAEAFAENLAEVNFKKPDFSVISNVDLSIYQSPMQIRTLLKEQLYSPVRWVETIQFMKKNEIEIIFECGPGKVLNGLIKRIDRSIIAISVNDLQSLDQALNLSF